MRDKIKAEEPKKEKPAKKGGGSAVPRALIGVLNGSFLTKEKVVRNMPFLLYVAGLMLCYIAYGYWTERTVRELDRTNSELKEMRSEYITVRSHLE
ncbi:MAG TPA: FtsL-like putative cell division protein, partial [Flavobacteriales bacterium]|nr:FtsL-like putative cell division protein [Flavobacteriales bacterium]